MTKTPKKDMKKNNHCKGFVFSLRKRTAKSAAKIGAIYRNETAVATGKYLIDIKNKLIEVTPVNPLNTSNFLLLPKIGIPFFRRKNSVKVNVLMDLKNTISKALILTRYLTVTFMQANDNVLMIINFIVFPMVISFVLSFVFSIRYLLTQTM